MSRTWELKKKLIYLQKSQKTTYTLTTSETYWSAQRDKVFTG